MPKIFFSHWRGLLFALIGVVATLWLSLTGQLGLYIHPRYFMFTVIMVAIGGVLAVTAYATLPNSSPDEHDHEEHSRAQKRWSFLGTSALLLISLVTLLVIPPTTLSSQTIENRNLNASAVPTITSAPLTAGDGSSFTVKDWAGLIRQGGDESFFDQASPDIVGFVTPDPDDPDIFYLARFVITCCAIDAQPVGVPVYLPGWADQYPVDDWVRVTGTFTNNPSSANMSPYVLSATEITAIDQPENPYVY